MKLDPATLLVISSIMTFVVGALLLFSWRQDKRNDALRLWSASCFVGTVASILFLLDGAAMRSAGREFGNAFYLLGFGLNYAAARRFNDLPTSWTALAAGPAVWFVAIWGFEFSFVQRIVMMSLLLGGYGFATARELWRGPDGLASQRAAAAVTAVYAFYNFVRMFTGPGIMPRFDWARAMDGAWISMMGLVILLYIMIFGFLIMSMAKERTDLEHRRAATLDPLTGVANRRGFMAAAGRMLEDCARHDEPVAVLLFDLDHFKSINDRFGHKTGDETLVEFCAAASAQLPAGSLFGRLGGEEFAAVLSGRDALTALDHADRIRAGFTRATRLVEMGAAATVSVGVAVGGPQSLVETLLADADRALYRAKEAGRDRVVAANTSTGREPTSPAPIAPLRPALAG